MKKISFLGSWFGLVCIVMSATIVIPHRAFADTTNSVFDVKPSTFFQRVVVPSFSLLGMSAERDGMLLLERFGLHTEGLTNKSLNVLRKFLKKYSKKSLPHRDCKIGSYKKLGHDFYKQLGGVIPYHNTIKTYRLRYEDATWSKIYTVGSGDIDKMHDNCGDEYATLDDKPAQCRRNMRAYFGNHDFELLSCK